MNSLVLDATHCLLMAALASRINWPSRSMFWKVLPDIIPDLTVHLPALIAAVRAETNRGVRDILAFHPLPTTFSPEAMVWREKLATAWEEAMKTEQEWESPGISSLRGLIQIDKCGIPSGMTCPSALPSLLSKARYIGESLKLKYPEQLRLLAALADWRPGPNVMTDPSVLNEWVDFWLKLYQKEDPNALVIMKGIAAKALLNLMETSGVKETGALAGMETVLLKSLVTAADVAGRTWEQNYDLDWLKWQPQEATRFPTDKLAKLPETLLKKFELSCRETDWERGGKAYKVINDALEQLANWDRAGLLDTCGIDILSPVATNLIRYIHRCSMKNFPITYLLSHKVRMWLIDSGVGLVKDGDELLWELKCDWEDGSKFGCDDFRSIGWQMRIRLQYNGLVNEDTSAFEKDILEAIKKEKSDEVRLALSIWKPGEETPNRVRGRSERLWKEGLKSDSKAVSLTSAVALLRPDPDDDRIDPVVRQQKLREKLQGIPQPLRPKLSIAEITPLTEQLPTGSPNTSPNTGLNQRWQFRPEETRFRIPTEPATPVSTPANVQTPRPDGTVQRIAGGRNRMDIAGDRPYRFL